MPVSSAPECRLHTHTQTHAHSRQASHNHQDQAHCCYSSLPESQRRVCLSPSVNYINTQTDCHNFFQSSLAAAAFVVIVVVVVAAQEAHEQEQSKAACLLPIWEPLSLEQATQREYARRTHSEGLRLGKRTTRLRQ